MPDAENAEGKNGPVPAQIARVPLHGMLTIPD